MDQIFEKIVEVIHLSPARQAQIYFKVAIDTAEKTITLSNSLDHFFGGRTGIRDTIVLTDEAVFHMGLAVGSLEEWLFENKIKYLKEENFGKETSIKITLL